MDLGLKDKRIAIAGGTFGIGRSISQCFAQEGCLVATCGRRANKVEETKEFLRKYHSLSFASQVDVANPDVFNSWLELVISRFKALDCYVHVVSAQSDDWRTSFEIDILGCIRGVELALPALKRSPSASITLIASKAALLSVPSYKAYSAMKAALISYASSLSRELAAQGIRVNTVSPGEVYFDEGFWARMEKEDPVLFEQALKNNPMQRFCKPEEVASAVVFLSSSAASFISGANLLVDGAGHEHVQF